MTRLGYNLSIAFCHVAQGNIDMSIDAQNLGELFDAMATGLQQSSVLRYMHKSHLP